MIPTIARTDENNCPAAFTTDIARQAGLAEGIDFTQGTQFPGGASLWTAKLLGDPVALTIRVIDRIGYFTHTGAPRWTYIALPPAVWALLTPEEKRDVVGYHYANEGGVAMRPHFPNYGARWLPLPIGWYRRL